MPYEWAFDAVGGGIIGLLVVLLLAVVVAYWHDLKSQIKEHKAANKELRDAINRMADTVEAWTPEQQHRRLRRP